MHTQRNHLALALCLGLIAGTSTAQDDPRRALPVASTGNGHLGPQDQARLKVRNRDRFGPVANPGEIGPLQPVGPQIESGVNPPTDFTIGAYTTNNVGMRWWNRGAPQTRILRSIGGGTWSVIQTFGSLPVNAYVDFRDLQASPNTENCYRISVWDGTNAFSTQTTPARCAITRDGRDLPVFRLRLRLQVANVENAGTDDAVEVRLQSPSWLVPAVTNWRPAGNSTWVDSTVNDFERNSNLTYDLMLTHVSQVSDITQITLAKPGSDDLCIAGLELTVNNSPAYSRNYGNAAATCARVGGENMLSVDYNELRNSTSWNQLSKEIFSGYDGAALRSIIQAQFAHALHGIGELRNGTAITTTRASEDRLKVFVPIRVYDVPILGDVDSNVHFDLVMSTAGKLSIENVDADSSDLLQYFMPIIGWKILYETSERIESTLSSMRPSGGGSSPLPDTHPCFTPDAGVSVCFDR